MSSIGTWDKATNSVEISLAGLDAPRVILTVTISNSSQSRETVELFQVVPTSSGGSTEILIGSWSNCIPSMLSFVTPLGPPQAGNALTYRVRATRYNSRCGTVLGTAQLPIPPDMKNDPELTMARWTWDFGVPASTEKAYIAIMLVDDNVGGN